MITVDLLLERPVRLGNKAYSKSVVCCCFFFTVTIFFSMKTGMLWWQILEVRFLCMIPQMISVSFFLA